MPKASGSEDADLGKLDFEAALGRLEAIVAELEGGKLGLEESLARFEQAMKLRDLCARKLREAEARVEEYTARAEAAAEDEGAAADDAVADAAGSGSGTGGLFDEL
jgi:exodeoxyribonuclease VII small subunit